MRHLWTPRALLGASTLVFAATLMATALGSVPLSASPVSPQAPPKFERTQAQVDAMNTGCLSCHTYDPEKDSLTMHTSTTAVVSCIDCHGGKQGVGRPAGRSKGDREFDRASRDAHGVEPRLGLWNKSSANPAGVWAETLRESEEYIRFVNPGDLRVANKACIACHAQMVAAVSKSMMRHGGMLWGAALYNNGSFPLKNTMFGEFYGADGTPLSANSLPVPSEATTAATGVLASLQPLFPFQVTQPGNILRVFERGGRKPLEVGIPDPDEEPGRPKNRLSNRGLGTLNRTDPVFIGLQKTRLLDPTLNFIGSNDIGGDFRSSGCTACHVTYANDRSPVHSGADAAAGSQGFTMTSDPMIPKSEPGHPIRHKMTRSVPTSQCMTCHMHPGTNMMSTYQGMTWWDNETDGNRMYPERTRSLSAGERDAIELRNPEGSALKGKWSDPAFLRETGTDAFNATLAQTVFGDSHGHNWLFRAVFKRDSRGRLLDATGAVVTQSDSAALREAVNFTDLRPPDQRPGTIAARAAERAGKPVHLKDIHLERGMQCVDCHFARDNHGDGLLYGEPRAAVEIACIDCHGSAKAGATLVTSGPGAPPGGTDLTRRTTPFGRSNFTNRDGVVRQNSMTNASQYWIVPQVLDSVTPGSPTYNAKAARAKTVQRGTQRWGDPTSNAVAHTDDKMTCTTCHSSWVTSCFGCHLSQTATKKKPALHNELGSTRNWTSYNFQVLRDDVYMLGKDGTVAGGRISPVRSSSAVVVSSEDLNRQTIYAQQQTVSAEGYSGQAFNTHVPHTVRGAETKTCTDCHVAQAGDNNARMAQLLLLGTNVVNFMGRFVYVATGHGGVEAVPVTEKDEPQAVIGSDLHKLAYPEAYAAHERRQRTLGGAIHHGSSNALGIQARGEYLYIADGSGGLKVFDIAQINNKGFSERIVSSPVSGMGQKTNVRTSFASAVAAPSTLAVDPTRQQMAVNEEQPIHPVYGYLYVADEREGLVLTTAAPLLDGNPSNNFLKRVLAFNPAGKLDGATNVTIAGHFAYVLCRTGLVIVDLDKPEAPLIVAEIRAPQLNNPTGIAIQFRYAFITDAAGLKVVDITTPSRPRIIDNGRALVELKGATNIYAARTFAYVAAGAAGLAIIDIEKPEAPALQQMFTAGGQLNDVRDVKIAMTNASVFAYVADGRNGLRVLQMVSSNTTPGAFGFSPVPVPALIATYKTHEPALAISEGLDRDRAVDESGHQIAVFGRRGSRPMNLTEMQRMYLNDGKVWTVTNEPTTPAVTTGATAPIKPAAPWLAVVKPVPSHGGRR
jgi:hypothetical protein